MLLRLLFYPSMLKAFINTKNAFDPYNLLCLSCGCVLMQTSPTTSSAHSLVPPTTILVSIRPSPLPSPRTPFRTRVRHQSLGIEAPRRADPTSSKFGDSIWSLGRRSCVCGRGAYVKGRSLSFASSDSLSSLPSSTSCIGLNPSSVASPTLPHPANDARISNTRCSSSMNIEPLSSRGLWSGFLNRITPRLQPSFVQVSRSRRRALEPLDWDFVFVDTGFTLTEDLSLLPTLPLFRLSYPLPFPSSIGSSNTITATLSSPATDDACPSTIEDKLLPSRRLQSMFLNRTTPQLQQRNRFDVQAQDQPRAEVSCRMDVFALGTMLLPPALSPFRLAFPPPFPSSFGSSNAITTMPSSPANDASPSTIEYEPSPSRTPCTGFSNQTAPQLQEGPRCDLQDQQRVDVSCRMEVLLLREDRSIACPVSPSSRLSSTLFLKFRILEYYYPDVLKSSQRRLSVNHRGRTFAFDKTLHRVLQPNKPQLQERPRYDLQDRQRADVSCRMEVSSLREACSLACSVSLRGFNTSLLQPWQPLPSMNDIVYAFPTCSCRLTMPRGVRVATHAFKDHQPTPELRRLNIKGRVVFAGWRLCVWRRLSPAPPLFHPLHALDLPPLCTAARTLQTRQDSPCDLEDLPSIMFWIELSNRITPQLQAGEPTLSPALPLFKQLLACPALSSALDAQDRGS
ncbi:hypothetical protein NLJ89_g5878 [Agrocybe chaxingu]|uniref:Uncharacterized protein n=1 Tax=Agrocybe chaxingu TaxID=84603 RepID=A0A9W8JZE4_9AGAR|nr:hypothetical protein NLJ89_g5878 [Agrocybe chaxingu]